MDIKVTSALPRVEIALNKTAGAPAGTASRLTTPRRIALTGDATGSTMFDGSEDVSIMTTVETVSNTELEELFR